ncbi:hypothetical protein Ddc_08001 [Ditylenchus destructor]|nr:hypothetical protein Ddc_08001 [Ditylenchus destructor]
MYEESSLVASSSPSTVAHRHNLIPHAPYSPHYINASGAGCKKPAYLPPYMPAAPVLCCVAAGPDYAHLFICLFLIRLATRSCLPFGVICLLANYVTQPKRVSGALLCRHEMMPNAERGALCDVYFL